jgi:acyl-CoA synthetase (NDP forming)
VDINRIKSIQEYLDSLEAFTTIPVDQYPERCGIGVLSASGGACALIADTVERFDMELPTLPEQTCQRIAEKLPGYGSATNPVDLTGRVITDMGFFGQFIEDMVKYDPIDAVLLQLGNTGPDYTRPIREDLCHIAAEFNNPIIVTGDRATIVDLVAE